MAIAGAPYRTSLRILGRLLNGDKARMVTICELEEGFLLHYSVEGDPFRIQSRAVHKAEILDLDDQLHQTRGKAGGREGSRRDKSRSAGLFSLQKTHPLAAVGYEEFLRAVGSQADKRGAQALMITELEDHMHIEYTIDRADFVLRDGQRLALPGRRQETYDARGALAAVRVCREQVVETVRSSGQKLAFNPMDVAAYISAALALEEEGQDREAEELYLRAANVDRNFPEVQYHLARLARRKGDGKKALKHMQQATALRGDDARFLHLIARLNIDRGNLDGAKIALEKAVERAPENVVYRFDLERLHKTLGVEDLIVAPIARATMTEEAPTASPVSESPSHAPPEEGAGEEMSVEREVPERLARTSSRRFAHRPLSINTINDRLAGYDAPETSNVPVGDANTLFGRRATTWNDTDASEEKPHPEQESLRLGDDGLPILEHPVKDAWLTPSPPPTGVPLEMPVATGALPIEASPLVAAITEKIRVSNEQDGVTVLDAAIQRTQELIEAEPHRADLHRKLGFLFAKAGQSDEAAASFRRAVECGRRRMTGG